MKKDVIRNYLPLKKTHPIYFFKNSFLRKYMKNERKSTDLPDPGKYIQSVEGSNPSLLSNEELKNSRNRLDLIRVQCRRDKRLDLEKRAADQYVLIGKELKKREDS